MKGKSICAILLSISLTLLTLVPVYATEYPGLLRISETRDSIVIGIDANGNEWAFLDPEDWEKGDLCAVIFENKGTPIIYDDEIRQTRYVGYLDLYK